MVSIKRHLIRTITARRFVRGSILFANIILLLGVFLYVSRNGSQAMQTPSFQAASTAAAPVPVDQLSSADIAVNIAQATGLPETTAVTNQADSVDATLSMASVGSTVVSEPQVVATAFKSRFDIQTYVVQNGDTVSSIATKFNVTSNSILWSNGLTGNAVAVSTKLYIPPMNGIVYFVKSGDTAQSIAQKYNTNQAQLIAVNDAELAGFQTGEEIIIPNGQEPNTASAASLLGISTSGNLAASYAGFGQCEYDGKAYSNYGYDCGYCTWWAAFQRAQAGDPVPSNLGEAYSWADTAAAMGIPEGSKPQAGAVIWFPGADHVGYVVSVGSDGTTTISEMNRAGWDIVDERTFMPAEADGYVYIY